MMEEKQLKLLVSAGSLKTATLECSRTTHLISFILQGEKVYLTAQRGGPRGFRTTDAAINFLRKQGFKKANIQI